MTSDKSFEKSIFEFENSFYKCKPEVSLKQTPNTVFLAYRVMTQTLTYDLLKQT